jgi:hypothetical protein
MNLEDHNEWRNIQPCFLHLASSHCTNYRAGILDLFGDDGVFVLIHLSIG